MGITESLYWVFKVISTLMFNEKSRFVGKVAVFTALTAVLDALIIPQLSSGVWFGLVYLIVPVTGILLGPRMGFISTLIGVFVGHTISPRGLEEFLFTLGAPIGALMSSFLHQKRWIPLLGFFTFSLVSYFLTPITQVLPFWGMWDVYIAFLLLLLVIGIIHLRSKWWENNWVRYSLSAFIGLESDVLFRIFLFIPVGTYQSIYGLPDEVLASIWVAGALITPIKVGVSTLLTTIIGPRLDVLR
jgi:hypothetical protein